MPTDPPRLVLASASPRRRELLARLTSPFDVIISTVEENPWNLSHRDFQAIDLPAPYDVPPEANPTLWGWRKAEAVVPQATSDGRDALILGADTIVVVDGDVLGKPRDAEDARAMLRRLAGRPHHVVTGWAFVLAHHDGPGAPTISAPKYGYLSSMVQMGDYSESVIDWYVRTGEPLDKAGAYAAQGLGADLVERVDGCLTNVIGLPLCEIREVLMALGGPVYPGTAWHGDCKGPYCSLDPQAPSDPLNVGEK
ncbi:MAG: Maf family protein [Chloroflexia bacterium]